MRSRSTFELTVDGSRSPVLPDWAWAKRTTWRVTEDRWELADGRIVSSPLRTLFRCAAIGPDVRFEKSAEQMWRRGLITPHEAADYLAEVRRQGRRGVSRFERWLEHAVTRSLPSQSNLEVELAHAVTDAGLPRPQRQYELRLPTAEVIHLDLAWPAVRLGLEPGARVWHGGDAKVRADHGRDRACDELGWRILRFDEVELRDARECVRQIVRIHRERERTLRSL